MPAFGMTDILVLMVTSLLLWFLLHPALRNSPQWRATVTPLASIIGSGFLVVAPLLAFMAGRYAVLAITAIVIVAWLVGGAIRFNIRHIEPIVESDAVNDSREKLMQWLERISKVALSIAYIIAVAFYLELLGAFVLRLFEVESQLMQKLLATGLLLFIAGVGWWRGLRMLEGLEEYAVAIKLAIIAGLLVGLAAFNTELVVDGQWLWPDMGATWSKYTFFQLLGTFLIVQGFETSRYLHGVYPADTRITSMQRSQIISGVIYVVFIALATPLFADFSGVSETGIIDLSGRVTYVLPVLLILGAVMAQFSASVADTISSGGLAQEASRGKLQHRYIYIVSTMLACLLVWASDIFAVIAYASRAFAAYYALQCMMASMQCFYPARNPPREWGRGLLYLLLTLLMLVTFIYGVPAESN